MEKWVLRFWWRFDERLVPQTAGFIKESASREEVFVFPLLLCSVFLVCKFLPLWIGSGKCKYEARLCEQACPSTDGSMAISFHFGMDFKEYLSMKNRDQRHLLRMISNGVKDLKIVGLNDQAINRPGEKAIFYQVFLITCLLTNLIGFQKPIRFKT